MERRDLLAQLVLQEPMVSMAQPDLQVMTALRDPLVLVEVLPGQRDPLALRVLAAALLEPQAPQVTMEQQGQRALREMMALRDLLARLVLQE